MRAVAVWFFAALLGAAAGGAILAYGLPDLPIAPLIAAIDPIWLPYVIGVLVMLVLAGLGRVSGAMGR